MEADTPIKTVEEARRYFQSMGCSGFHMYREYPERYAEYRSLGISQEQEAKWRAESISTMLAELKSGELDRKLLWSVHSQMANLVTEWQLGRFLEDVFEASCAIKDSLSQMDRLLVAETIVGRQKFRYRSGLIFQSHDAGRAQLAAQFAALARRLADKHFKAEEKESRRQQFLAKLAETEKLCSIETQ